MQATRFRIAVVAIVGTLVTVVGTVLPFVGAFPTNPVVTPASQAVIAAENVLWLLVAGIVAARQPDRFWLLPLALAIANEVWTFAYTGVPAVFFLSAAFTALPTAIYAHILLAFPHGRLRSRFDVAVTWVAYAVVAINAAATLFLVEPGYSAFTNPFVIVDAGDLGSTIQRLAGYSVPVIGLGLLYGVWRHWQLATPAGRRALRPLLFAVPIFYAVSSLGYLADNLGLAELSALIRTPVVIATAVLTPLGYLIGTLRSRLGRGRLVELATTLGPGVPLGGMRDVLARAVDDPTLEVVFPGPGGGFVDSGGRPVEPSLSSPGSPRATTPVERNGEVLAFLVHDPAIDEDDPGLVPAAGSMAALALQNERLAAEVRSQLEEVRASRARIVEAADEERRKVERNLHDGAQQRLVALAMRLEQARATTPGSAELIDATTAELRTAVAEVRQLARGMHPPILTEAGLAAAVESLVERTPLPVTVRMSDDRFAPQIEAAAYYVVVEALTNIARHAGAVAASVESVVEAGTLRVTITDDGPGGADPARGTGLRGLRDRIAAVGGTLELASPASGGTRLTASFPLR